MDNEKQKIQIPDWEGEEMKMPENMDAQPIAKEKTSIVNGPLLFFLTLLLMCILGGMYYWLITLSKEPTEPEVPTTQRPSPAQNTEPESTTAQAQTEIMQTTSPSDEINALEADIEATNFDELDAELEAIDAELEASLQQ